MLHYTQSYLSYKKKMFTKKFHSHNSFYFTSLLDILKRHEWNEEEKKIKYQQAMHLSLLNNFFLFSFLKTRKFLKERKIHNQFNSCRGKINCGLPPQKSHKKWEKKKEPKKNFYCRKLNLFISYRCTKWKTVVMQAQVDRLST